MLSYFKKITNPMENENASVELLHMFLLIGMGAIIAIDKPRFALFLLFFLIALFGLFVVISKKQINGLINLLKHKDKRAEYLYIYLKYEAYSKNIMSWYFSFLQMCFLACMNIKDDNNILKITDLNSFYISLFSVKEAGYLSIILNWCVLCIFAGAGYILWSSLKPHFKCKKAEELVNKRPTLLAKYNGLFVEEESMLESLREKANENLSAEEREGLHNTITTQLEKKRHRERL